MIPSNKDTGEQPVGSADQLQCDAGRDVVMRQEMSLNKVASSHAVPPDSAAKQAAEPATNSSDCRHAADQLQLRDAAVAGCERATLDTNFSSTSSDQAASAPGAATTPQPRPRGWAAMLCSPRQQQSGQDLPSPAGTAEHAGLLLERAASSNSTHRALLSSSPEPCGVPVVTSPVGAAVAAAELELSPSNYAASGGSAAAAGRQSSAGVGPDRDIMQEQQSQHTTATTGEAPSSDTGSTRRSGGIPRPTLVIPQSPAATGYYGSPVAQMPAGQGPGSATAGPYSPVPVVCVDDLDLDVIDDIAGVVDPSAPSTSSSPIVGGASHTRAPSSHLRSSRDQDLRRAALLNHMLSPRPQQAVPVITAQPPGGISVFAEGPPVMFTGSTRARGLAASAGSNNSSTLQSPAAGVEQPAGGAPSGESLYTLLHNMRLSRGTAPSPASTGSPAQPSMLRATRSLPPTPAAAPAGPGSAGAAAGSSRASSLTGSPVPPPSHGAAAALLAGSVVASPRTPRSPLSLVLSPGPHSAQRMLLAQNALLPGPLFGNGFGLTNNGSGTAGTSPGTSPGTSSVAAAGSTASSCTTGTGTGAAGGTATFRGSLLSPAATSRFFSPSPSSVGEAAIGEQAQQQQHAEEQLQHMHMHQLLRQQLHLHDTRLGPHGESPLSPSHHHTVQHQQLPPRGETLLSPSRPTPLVPPALMSASNTQLADSAAAAEVADWATADRTVGGVGRDSIHEWLDHHSWRMQYELPLSLRDAADLRDAAAVTRNAHGPAARADSRGSSVRDGLGSNPGSPWGLLLGAPQGETATNFSDIAAAQPLPGADGLQAGAAACQQQPLPPPAFTGVMHQVEFTDRVLQQPAQSSILQQPAPAAAVAASSGLRLSHSWPGRGQRSSRQQGRIDRLSGLRSSHPPYPAASTSLGPSAAASSGSGRPILCPTCGCCADESGRQIDCCAAAAGPVQHSSCGLGQPCSVRAGSSRQAAAAVSAADARCIGCSDGYVCSRVGDGSQADSADGSSIHNRLVVGPGLVTSGRGPGLRDEARHQQDDCLPAVDQRSGATCVTLQGVHAAAAGSSSPPATLSLSSSEAINNEAMLAPAAAGQQHALGHSRGEVSSSSVRLLSPGSHLYPAGSPVGRDRCCYSCQEQPPAAAAVAATGISRQGPAAALPRLRQPAAHQQNSPAGGVGAVRQLQLQQDMLQATECVLGPALTTSSSGHAEHQIHRPVQQQIPGTSYGLPGIEFLLQRPSREQSQQHGRIAAVLGGDDPFAAGCRLPSSMCSVPDGQSSRQSVASQAGVTRSSQISSRSAIGGLLHDKAFIDGLLSSLPCVDPGCAVVVHAVTELQQALTPPDKQL